MKFERPLFELPPAPPDMPDPVHNDRDLWNGIDVATEYLGFTLEDIAILFRYRRPAAIWHLAKLGAVLNPDGSTGSRPRQRANCASFCAKQRVNNVSEVIELNREKSGWLRPYKLEENLNVYLTLDEAARQLYRAVVDGRVRARYRGRILGPKWLRCISEKKWHPTEDYALPADIELSVEDAERIWFTSGPR